MKSHHFDVDSNHISGGIECDADYTPGVDSMDSCQCVDPELADVYPQIFDKWGEDIFDNLTAGEQSEIIDICVEHVADALFDDAEFCEPKSMENLLGI